MDSLDFLQNNVVKELKEKGFELEDIQKMTFEDMANNLYYPKFRLEVDSQYGESVLYASDKVVSEKDSFMYTLPNGTLIITKPALSKYIEKFVVDSGTQHSEFGKPFYIKKRNEPWDRDEECLEYERSILKKRDEKPGPPIRKD
ncbi:TPA: hypothetical protein QFQ46_001932 [Enterococcus faecium]|nr:hypothetical protein [Enterococcus faecium]